MSQSHIWWSVVGYVITFSPTLRGLKILLQSLVIDSNFLVHVKKWIYNHKARININLRYLELALVVQSNLGSFTNCNDINRVRCFVQKLIVGKPSVLDS